MPRLKAGTPHADADASTRAQHHALRADNAHRRAVQARASAYASGIRAATYLDGRAAREDRRRRAHQHAADALRRSAVTSEVH